MNPIGNQNLYTFPYIPTSKYYAHLEVYKELQIKLQAGERMHSIAYMLHGAGRPAATQAELKAPSPRLVELKYR